MNYRTLAKRYQLVSIDLRLLIRRNSVFVALLLVVLTFGLLAQGFLSILNLLNIVVQSSTNAVVALGMTFVIISAGIDLSVGSVVALVAVIVASLMKSGWPVIAATVLSISIGAVCGAGNGLLISKLRLQPFIVTLGTMSLYRGIALVYTNGYPIMRISPNFKAAFSGALKGLPMPVLFVAILGLFCWLLLRYTVYGEHVQAIGGNEEAARLCGVQVDRIKVLTYTLSGVLSAFSAMILVARLGAAEPIAGQGWELDAIAASVLGGASLQGGRGNILGTIMGALLLGALRNGLTLLNVQTFYQTLATGVVILVAVLVDSITHLRES
jgi:ribose transport system permease protein